MARSTGAQVQITTSAVSLLEVQTALARLDYYRGPIDAGAACVVEHCTDGECTTLAGGDEVAHQLDHRVEGPASGVGDGAGRQALVAVGVVGVLEGAQVRALDVAVEGRVGQGRLGLPGRGRALRLPAAAACKEGL